MDARTSSSKASASGPCERATPRGGSERYPVLACAVTLRGSQNCRWQSPPFVLAFGAGPKVGAGGRLLDQEVGACQTIVMDSSERARKTDTRNELAPRDKGRIVPEKELPVVARLMVEIRSD